MLGHEAAARRLVIAGADVNFEDPVRQRSVLYEATLGGHEQLVADLLIGGANPNCRSGDAYHSPLHVAAYKGFDGILSILLLRGANKDALNRIGKTPLVWASGQGRLSVVKTLLAAGANLNVRGTDTYSALDHAATEGHGGVIEAIVRHGADVNACRNNGFTALHAAVQHDQAGAVDALIEAGADVEKVDGCTPLAAAAYFSSCKAMLALLQHGAKVDVRDTVGHTPLHEACWGRSEGFEAAVDNMLLRWGAGETALNEYGDRPADLLDLDTDEDDDNHSTQDEIERVRSLLARAPADRAWRRRAWLVMLRSPDSTAKAGTCSSDSHGAGGFEVTTSENKPGVEHDGPRKPDNRVGGELEAGGGGGVMDDAAGPLGFEMEGATRTASNDDGCVIGSEGGEEGLRLEAVPLIGLGLEGVFRTVVGFL